MTRIAVHIARFFLNASIGSLNSVIRYTIKRPEVFPTDDALKKVVWLAIQATSQKWTMQQRD